MGVIIPLESIKRFYRFPDETPRIRRFYSPGARFMIAYLLLMAYANYYGVPRVSHLVVYLILSIGAVLLLVAVTIVVVERAERKKERSAKAVIEKISSVDFNREDISIEVSSGLERNTHTFPVTDIKSVSGYVQDGWFCVRDRGVVIETNDNKQFRIVLDLNRPRFNLFIERFNLSLGELDYPAKKTRVFQV